jgi:hypothetical protein
MSKIQLYAHFCPMKNKDLGILPRSPSFQTLYQTLSSTLILTHTPAKSEGLEHPALRSLGQFPTKGEISYEKIGH